MRVTCQIATKGPDVNLSNLTLLLTRPDAAARRFLAEVEAKIGNFGQVIISPLIEIGFPDLSFDLAPDTVLAFTSENGARAAARFAAPRGRLAYCVGNRTAAVARHLGFDARSAGGDVGDLARILLLDRPTGTVLHLAGRHQSGDLAGELKAHGIPARAVIAYEQTEQKLTDQARKALAGSGTIVVPVFSPRSANLLAQSLDEATAPLWVAAISDAALDPLRNHATAAFSATSPDSAGVIAAMQNLIESAGLP